MCHDNRIRMSWLQSVLHSTGCSAHMNWTFHVLQLSNLNVVVTLVLHPTGCYARYTGHFACYDLHSCTSSAL